MTTLVKAASKGATDTLLAAVSSSFGQVDTPGWADMSVWAVFSFAVLTVDAGIEAGQKRDSFDVLLACFVFMFKRTLVLLAAWATQVMIVAKLGVSNALTDLV